MAVTLMGVEKPAQKGTGPTEVGPTSATIDFIR